MDEAKRALAQWSRLLVLVWGLALLMTLVFHAGAVLVIVNDESAHEEEWDGLGTFLAMWGIAIVLPVTIVAATMFVLSRSRRRRHLEDGQVVGLRRVAMTSIACTAVPLCLSFVGAVGQGSPLWAIVFVPSALLLVAAVGVVVSERTLTGATDVPRWGAIDGS